MESDRELLELAAKAAGYGKPWMSTMHEHLFVDIAGKTIPWNPLTDDGDALRLAVKTGVMRGRGFDNAWSAMYAVGQLPKDQCEAYRRAIVRAAAEIGKTLG